MANLRKQQPDIKELAQTRLAQLRGSFEPNVIPMTGGMHYAEQTKYIGWNCSKLKEPLELLHMTDLQFGHVLARLDKIVEYRDWVLAEPNRYMLWGGDMIDAGTRISISSPWEQICEPQGQIYKFCDLMAPARHRILGFVGGNHERRGIPTFGDLGSLIAHILEVPYSAGRQFIDFNFPKGKSFRVDLFHGRGAAQTAGAKMQMLHTFMQSGDAQIYLVGHLHDAMVKYNWRMVRDPLNHKVNLMKIAGAMSSSFLDYFGSYAEVAGLQANGLMMARVIVEPSGHWELTLR